ncbi:rhodanese-like domain-containing protein [Thalassotalea sp. ND16A]|uniref:rhodanese-like domain-containing protein n=1 Tax=Thalassotalea sp. ND16A TaxID=1535422 RepID=UPI00051A58E7|nr:rhodanese-like domain-containing protein [Thalassotalea sp. ND16A]KGJ89475.1 hypothetical protein ND16A_2368 [Thalassotalea sp. ND16A]
MLKAIKDLIQQVAQNTRRITAAQAIAEIQQNKGLLIDVRMPAEHLAKPVMGATNIPRGVIEMTLMETEKDPKRPIYLHCATSARATLAAEQLQRVGYENVTVITCEIDKIQIACT